MSRIIDLKNKRVQQETEERHSFVAPVRPRPSPRPEPTKPTPPPEELAPVQHKENTINWSGPAYLHVPDPKSVAITVIILFGIAVLNQIFQENWIGTTFFALLGLMVILRASKKPPVIDFEINSIGVKAGDRFYRFKELKSFWIEYEPELGIKELSLQQKKWYYQYTKIPIYDQNPVQIRLTLLSFIPELEHKDNLADAITRRLGF